VSSVEWDQFYRHTQNENTRVITVAKDWLGPANNDLMFDSWLSIADTRKLRYKEFELITINKWLKLLNMDIANTQNSTG